MESESTSRPLANAGHGLGHGFLDQDVEDIRHVIDTNVIGTVRLVHAIGRDMRLAMSNVVPDAMLAEQHRRMAEPGGAEK